MSDLTDESGGTRSPSDLPLSGGGAGPPSSERIDRFFDGLESAAAAIEKDGPLGAPEAEALRTLGEAAGPARRPRFRVPIPLAAAALVVFGALLYGVLAPRPIVRPPGVIGFIAQHVPGELPRTRAVDSKPERNDWFQFTASDECHVFLFFRSWKPGLKALHWSYQVWRDNSPRRQVAADETIACEMKVTEDPPIPQFYVLAASRLPGDLPGGEEEAQALLKSVEEAFRRAGSADNLPSCVAAVRASLPPSVAVVGGEFVVR